MGSQLNFQLCLLLNGFLTKQVKCLKTYEVKSIGWYIVKYPEFIEDNYLHNRGHLIAFSLVGENSNERNLIMGSEISTCRECRG